MVQYNKKKKKIRCIHMHQRSIFACKQNICEKTKLKRKRVNWKFIILYRAFLTQRVDMRVLYWKKARQIYFMEIQILRNCAWRIPLWKSSFVFFNRLTWYFDISFDKTWCDSHKSIHIHIHLWHVYIYKIDTIEIILINEEFLKV